jgi:hypothetical protein
LHCGHGDDAETAPPTTFTLNREIDPGDIAVSGKQALQIPFGSR